MKRLLLIVLIVIGGWLILRPPRLFLEEYESLEDAIYALVRPRLTAAQADAIADLLVFLSRKDRK